MPRFDQFQEDLIVETPKYLHTDYVGICRDEAGTIWVASRHEAGDLSLAAYSPTGTLLSSHSLDAKFQMPQKPKAPIPMAGRRGRVYIAMGRMLVRHRTDLESIAWEMPFPIRTLTPSPSHTVTRMIATFDDG